jgi:hypothetical protein
MGNENRGSDAGASPFAQGLTHQPALNIVARLREEHGAGLAGDALGLEAAAEIERLLGANIILLAGLHEICEPITVMGDADSVSACQDLHELICMTAQDAIAKARTWAAPKSEADNPNNGNRYDNSAAVVIPDFEFAKARIVALDTKSLWAILRSTNAMTERFASELTWAKAELRRRGFAVV